MKEENEEDLSPGPRIPTLPEAPKWTPQLPPHPAKAERNAKLDQYQRMGIAYTIPAALVAPIVVLTVAGAWLDARYHQSPLFTLGGALLGTISGFINMIRIANKLNR
jgi:F0F1-type ATP synthase assembly protein I